MAHTHEKMAKMAPDFSAFDDGKIAKMEAITGPPARELLALAGVFDAVKTGSVRLLESAAGGGCLTAALFRVVPSSEMKDLEIVCGDVVPEMVSLASARSTKEGWKYVETKIFDGMAIPYADSTFTHALIHYGIQLYPDPQKGISENYRVLQKGGVFGVSVWHTPGFLPYLQRADPDFVIPPPMRHPITLPDSAKASLEASGFINVRHEDVSVPVPFESPAAAVRGWREVMGGLFKSDENAARVEQLLREDHGDGPFTLYWRGINLAAEKA
ncbi:hypothetical protein JCM10908_005558 [Rhodotorula pacifica]|uniref:class I SAM-dependent methyltransferase n=1 Tax=Rhodotorula pacifica TaxID=1495444 RepID=UPI00317020DD